MREKSETNFSAHQMRVKITELGFCFFFFFFFFFFLFFLERRIFRDVSSEEQVAEMKREGLGGN